MNIFTRHPFVPAQFPDIEWDLDKIHAGLRQLGYTKGSPGYKAIENKVHVNDLHATMLHLLGIDHEKLTYRNNGRDYRLTDLGGRVITELLA